MDNCALPMGMSALACAIAQQITSTKDLVLLAAFLNQLASTLASIAAVRDVCESNESQITEKSQTTKKSQATEEKSQTTNNIQAESKGSGIVYPV